MNTKDDERTKLLSSIKDPNEYIRAYRAMMAEDSGAQVDEILPLDKEPACDIATNFIGLWLAVRADLPIEGREQVIKSVNDLIGILQELQEYLPADRDQLRLDILQCLRHGTGMMPR